MLVNVTCPLTNSPGAIRIPATLVLRRDGSIASIKIAQNEGDTIAVPVTPVSSAPVPGQMATSNFPVADSIAAQKESFPVAPHDKEDAQRLEHKFHREFVDYATVLIGLYAAASGIPAFLILLVEDIVAFGSDFGDNKDWDPIFRNLPERNVKNTDMGYLLYNSGRIAPLSKP